MHFLSLILKSIAFNSIWCKGKFFIITFFISTANFEKSPSREFLVFEKKFAKDFIHKKMSSSPEFGLENFQVIFVDKESKVLGYKKTFDSKEKGFALPFSENKSFLKSTVFGSVRFLET